ncbi:uncharacterized protein KY384_000998 [Bacidia gigantensis]|uniref:uncharacterized protein n=1 Tax=Bacidia gigantensis TaxID=2732470 RepID=UPI001D05A968|nr:uncharacterized protein KY384_000998 [Bacidia gigantensis]KAG8534154.1 hypothetical protein KY384_000998 [Bacidia gigantensis]
MTNWEKVKGICQPCRDLLSADKPFDCEAGHVSPHWICKTCRQNGDNSIVGDRVIKLPDCSFPLKPSKQEKVAWVAFISIYGKDGRRSEGGHLAGSNKRLEISETPKPVPVDKKAVEKPSLIVHLKIGKPREAESDNKVEPPAVSSPPQMGDQWSTTVNRPPTPPDSIAEAQSIVGASNKTSPVDLDFQSSSVDQPKSRAPDHQNSTEKERHETTRKSPAVVEIEDDDITILTAAPRKRRRLHQGLREGEETDLSAEDQTGLTIEQSAEPASEKSDDKKILESTLLVDKTPKIRPASHSNDALLEKWISTAERRKSQDQTLEKSSLKLGISKTDEISHRQKEAKVEDFIISERPLALPIESSGPILVEPSKASPPPEVDSLDHKVSFLEQEMPSSPKILAIHSESPKPVSQVNYGPTSPKVQVVVPQRSTMPPPAAIVASRPVVDISPQVDENPPVPRDLLSKHRNKDSSKLQSPTQIYEWSASQFQFMPIMFQQEYKDLANDPKIQYSLRQSSLDTITWAEPTTLARPPTQEFVTRLQAELPGPVFATRIPYPQQSDVALQPHPSWPISPQASAQYSQAQLGPAYRPAFGDSREMIDSGPRGSSHGPVQQNDLQNKTQALPPEAKYHGLPNQNTMAPGLVISPKTEPQISAINQLEGKSTSYQNATKPQPPSFPEQNIRFREPSVEVMEAIVPPRSVSDAASPSSMLERSSRDIANKPSRKSSFFADDYLFNMTNHSKAKEATSSSTEFGLNAKKSNQDMNVASNTTGYPKTATEKSKLQLDSRVGTSLVDKTRALSPVPTSEANLNKPAPLGSSEVASASSEPIVPSLAFVAVNSNPTRVGSGFALKTSPRQTSATQQLAKTPRRRATKKVDYQLPNIAPKLPPYAKSDSKQSQLAPSAHIRSSSQSQKEASPPVANPSTSKYVFLHRTKSQPPKASSPGPPGPGLPDSQSIANGGRPAQHFPHQPPSEAGAQPSLDHSDIFDRYPYGGAPQGQRSQQSISPTQAEVTEPQTMPRRSSLGSQTPVNKAATPVLKRPLPSELAAAQSQHAQKAQRLSGPPPFAYPPHLRPLEMLGNTNSPKPPSLPNSPNSTQFPASYSQFPGHPAAFPPGFPAHQSQGRSYSFAHPSPYAPTAPPSAHSQPQSPFPADASSSQAIEAAKINIFVSVGASRVAIRLGACGSAYDFIKRILSKVGDKAAAVDSLQVDFTWMEAGDRDKSLMMRLADQEDDKEESFNIIKEEIEKRHKASGEPARLNVDVLTEGEGR